MTSKILSAYILGWAKKIKAINILGGKCAKCGCPDPRVLDFHHPNDDKEHDINTLRDDIWRKIEKEINKCILLCRNCHGIEHFSSDVIDTRSRVNKSILLAFIGKKECMICGWNKHQCALHFHHKEGEVKKFNLSKVYKRLYSVNDIELEIINEINKCDLLCANCHQLRHISPSFELYKNEILKKSGHIKNQIKYNHDEVIRLYQEEFRSVGSIAKLLGSSKNSIKGILKRRGLYRPYRDVLDKSKL